MTLVVYAAGVLMILALLLIISLAFVPRLGYWRYVIPVIVGLIAAALILASTFLGRV